MKFVLRYVLTGTRGGPHRVRLLRAIGKHPGNSQQLADDLGLHHTKTRHHLDVLVDNGFVEGGGDGAIYHLTDRIEQHWTTVERIADRIE